jgi:hypothetical protein
LSKKSEVRSPPQSLLHATYGILHTPYYILYLTYIHDTLHAGPLFDAFPSLLSSLLSSLLKVCVSLSLPGSVLLVCDPSFPPLVFSLICDSSVAPYPACLSSG